MYSLARRHWEAHTVVPDSTHDWEFVDIVATSTITLADPQPAEAWPPKETPSRPLLRRLQRRATVTPGAEPAEKSEGQKEFIKLEKISSNKDEIQDQKESIKTRVSSSKKDTQPPDACPAATPEEDHASHTHAFQLYIEEAAATLDKVSRGRNRPPWWERLLIYLRAVWKDEPVPSRTTSSLLYWHVHALEHERISVKPIANGEYVVAFDSAIILQKPEKDMPSFYKLLRSFSHAVTWSHERLDSPSESRKNYINDD
ncbi:hypothetical protein E2C01_058288 [Portunus trituberculatus]|uniref:Uncharacterized protein n=1 Tax=Portunus trituberculatus TaxID=210409 RepID=A0A5B7H4A4_PORTR|nr:hypothetical protein [Portunus trituberculatus]